MLLQGGLNPRGSTFSVGEWIWFNGEKDGQIQRPVGIPTVREAILIFQSIVARILVTR